MRFEWDAINRAHVAAHGFAPDFVEAVVLRGTDRAVQRRARDRRFVVEARHEGRDYRVILTWQGDDLFRPITAHPIRKRSLPR